MTLNSALFEGLVVHQRVRPKTHRLSYRVFCLLLDLDEISRLKGAFRLLGINGPGVFSVHEKDHGDGGDLRAWVRGQLSEAGLVADGRVSMLCYPRVFGYVFNPLTVYYCHDRSDRLTAVIYEVNNTFGERHAYVLPAASEGKVVRNSCAKQFYVSPFMPMDCRYDFTLREPDDKVQVLIDESDAEGPMLSASFTGRREALSDGALMRMLLKYPLMTVKVMAGIHLEAVRIVMKGIRFIPHPPKGAMGGGNLTRRANHVPRQAK